MINKIPIVYSDRYNIRLLGLQKLHPFDSEKYEKVYLYLVNELNIKPEAFYIPGCILKNELLKIHTEEYLSSLAESSNIAQIAEMALISFIPNSILQKNLLEPMRFACEGTVMACQLAMKYGWSINLSGGYHHAKSDSGGGFCYFADVPLAIKILSEKFDNLKILIVDLDAHQGNGNAAILHDNPRIKIFDIYNQDIYPMDFQTKNYIDYHYPVNTGSADKEYLYLVKKGLEESVNLSKPELIIYIAGTDIYKEDPLGGLNISETGIMKRDEMVFETARSSNIPIAMVLSGGYTLHSHSIISRSIENLLPMLPL